MTHDPNKKFISEKLECINFTKKIKYVILYIITLKILIFNQLLMPETLFNLKIFKWIEKNVVEEIILNSCEKNFKAWEIIFLEWAPSDWEWYIIKSWSVKISINWQKVAELHGGDIVWEIALLNEEARTATVTALEDTEVIVLTLESLIEMLNHDDNSINKEIIRRIEENVENS